MAVLTLLGNFGLAYLLPANVWAAPKDLWDGLCKGDRSGMRSGTK